MKILEKFTISKKEKGKYKAFPTVVKNSKQIIVAYREGFTDKTKPHGKNGCVRITTSNDLKIWDDKATPFCDNELDAIISKPLDNELILATRSYEYKKRNESYISKFDINNMPKTRKVVTIENVKLSAFFGHIFKHDDELIAIAYGSTGSIKSPLVLSSEDKGDSWQLKSPIITDTFRPILNETSIVEYKNKFLAIMRSQEPSYDLYTAESKNLTEWSTPQKMSILGHAPMTQKLKDGRLAFVFRDLNDNLPGVSIAITEDKINWEVENICHYRGNLYNGGYADFIEIKPNVLFVVYYISDEDNEPWIEAVIVEI